jgi:hypothetical protein
MSMYAISVSVFQPPVCVALALTLLQRVMKSVKRRPGGRPWFPSMRYSRRLRAVMRSASVLASWNFANSGSQIALISFVFWR